MQDVRNDAFDFRFPINFIPNELINKYKPYLNRIPGNITPEPIDFLNSTIQSVNVTGLNLENVVQSQYAGRTVYHRNTLPESEVIGRSFDVNFRIIEGYINYWLLFETMLYYYNFETVQPYTDSQILKLLDNDGFRIVNIKFHEPLLISLDDTSFNFGENTIGFQSFSMTINYNRLEVTIDLD